MVSQKPSCVLLLRRLYLRNRAKVHCNYASDRFYLQDTLVTKRDRYRVRHGIIQILERPEDRGPKTIAINVEPFCNGLDFEIWDLLPGETISLEEIIIFRYKGNLKDVVDYDLNGSNSFLPRLLMQ